MRHYVANAGEDGDLSTPFGGWDCIGQEWRSRNLRCRRNTKKKRTRGRS